MRRSVTIVFFVFGVLSVKAQQPFFSQFYNASYTVNPAFTGTAYGYVRAGLNYKSYFNDFEQFQTTAGHVDLSLLENDRNPDYAGVGMAIIHDQSGKAITNTKAMLSFAYHNAYGRSRNEFIAFGMQAGIDNTNVDFTGLTTQNQWVNGIGFDPGLANGENIESDNSTVVDFSAGFMWYKFLNNGASFNAGVSVYHLGRPGREFLGQKNPIERRLSVHGSARLPLTEVVNFAPSLFYFFQGDEHTINPGGAIEFSLREESYFSLGVWARNLDVFIGAIQVEYANFILGASYDLLLSSISDETRNGGFELSMSYLIKRTYKKRARIKSLRRPGL
ncbi:MAG: PorP/SprF family type IX secretion system membrane protein [Bacteroidota bacterium]